MSAHTLTPWFISDHNRTKIVVTIKGNDLFWVVAETGFGPAVMAEANAAYIVECVNSHAELLATTAKLREALTELLDARGTSLNIVGHDPVSGHPLSREGMAALKARTALSSTTP